MKHYWTVAAWLILFTHCEERGRAAVLNSAGRRERSAEKCWISRTDVLPLHHQSFRLRSLGSFSVTLTVCDDGVFSGWADDGQSRGPLATTVSASLLPAVPRRSVKATRGRMKEMTKETSLSHLCNDLGGEVKPARLLLSSVHTGSLLPPTWYQTQQLSTLSDTSPFCED